MLDQVFHINVSVLQLFVSVSQIRERKNGEWKETKANKASHS